MTADPPTARHEARPTPPDVSLADAPSGARTAIPTMMIAIAAPEPGGTDALVRVERPVPVPGPGEVLIRVAAAGVNRADVVQRMGLYPPPPGVTDVPGLEVAGHVVAAGPAGADGFDPALMLGQAVAALVSGGGYAPWCVADGQSCLPIPTGLSMVEAAAMPETLFTVWTNLFERGGAADGDAVLVHGGTSGIGTMAIALGQIFGLKVIVTCGSAEKTRAALALGAACAINYREQDFVTASRDSTGGRGVAVVLDMVGGDYLPRNLACLADDGRHVSIAFQRGPRAEVDIMDIMRRRLTLTGSTLRARDRAFKALVADEIARTVWPHVAGGTLRPLIDTVFALEDVGAAHDRMEAGQHVGKIVLAMDA